MPKWNLRDDWPDEYRPKDKNNFLIDLFSMPFSDGISENLYKLSLDCSFQNQKKLVINIQSPQVDILAMTPGSVKSNGNTLTLNSHIFSLAELNKILFERLKKVQQGMGTFPISWFKKWIEAGTVPSKIIYENVTGVKSGEVRAGEKIGTTNQNPTNPQQQEVKISVEYGNSKPGDLRFMHPREFFSLLFWEERCDPIFNTNPDQYRHTLLRKMMTTYEQDPIPANLANEATDIINRPTDDWLSLRPPLRTVQRVKWEHIKEHLRSDFKKDPTINPNPSNIGVWETGGDVSKRIINPYGLKSNYKTSPGKCNIYTGEILFRSGFRTTSIAYSYCPIDKPLPHRLKYMSPPQVKTLFSHKDLAHLTKDRSQINYSATGCTKDFSKVDHSIVESFGQKTKHDKKEVNDKIAHDGDVFIIASKKHIPIIYEITKIWNDGTPPVNMIEVVVMHQWKKDDFRNNYSDKGWNKQEVNETRIIRIFPGGDPTEEWGQLQSNCLKKEGSN
jgi:hypothetical protein